jgi:hypothetical protein
MSRALHLSCQSDRASAAARLLASYFEAFVWMPGSRPLVMNGDDSSMRAEPDQLRVRLHPLELYQELTALLCTLP